MTSFTPSALVWLQRLLLERFGHNFTLTLQAGSLELALAGSDRVIIFDQLQQVFHHSRSDFLCECWDAASEGFTGPVEDRIPAPSQIGLQSPLIETNNRGATIHYDVLGLTYWMLTRLEEIGRKDLDEHGRFPAASSHACVHGYLQRPIVDEWLIILGQVIKRVWTGICLKQNNFSIKLSHDVDCPSRYAFKTWRTIGRTIASDLVKRRDIKSMLFAPYVKLASHEKLRAVDPFNTFDWIMDVSESNNLKSAFYFICGHTHDLYDGDYDLEAPAMLNLLRNIHERGHEIGLHPSYGTYRKPELLKSEADRLKHICSKHGLRQHHWGGRMHYLRWEQLTTLNAWESAGLDYDSTLGYSDLPGFRCGTCHEYSGFDVGSQKQLGLRIRPLIAMDQALISPTCVNFSSDSKATKSANLLLNRSRAVAGTFTLLWHNSSFSSANLKKIYVEMINSNA